MSSSDEIVATQRHIGKMMGRGASFGSVEQVIERTALNEDQKSALWLFAWAHQPKWVLAHETSMTLSMLGD